MEERVKGGINLHKRDIYQNLVCWHTRITQSLDYTITVGAQWLCGRVLDSRPRGRGFEPHRHYCIVVLEQDIFILAKYWLNPV